ncbi:hypothetical protein ACIPID_18010, partial [Cupriavidus sp. CER94]|uniref:hypothetical protein n=1 Tax=Cupriavidus sp. CER94 TaxID=3377036 RepID=UPI003824D39C
QIKGLSVKLTSLITSIEIFLATGPNFFLLIYLQVDSIQAMDSATPNRKIKTARQRETVQATSGSFSNRRRSFFKP